jgi:NAD kinase
LGQGLKQSSAKRKTGDVDPRDAILMRDHPVELVHRELSGRAQQLSEDLLLRTLDEATGINVGIVDRQNPFGDEFVPDYVISHGGDGNVGEAFNRFPGIPIIGVNSDTDRSIGYLCCWTATSVLDALKNLNDPDISKLQTLVVTVRDETSNEVTTYPVLNEALITHQNPAASLNYWITMDDLPEQKIRPSYKFIASTATGSTGSVRAMGGPIMDIASERILTCIIGQDEPIAVRPASNVSIQYEISSTIVHRKKEL